MDARRSPDAQSRASGGARLNFTAWPMPPPRPMSRRDRRPDAASAGRASVCAIAS